MPLQPKREITRLDAGVHGGIDYGEIKELGFNPGDILDFSVCTNPFMPPPGLHAKLEDASITRYPDSAAGELQERLAARLGLPADNIMVGSGTTELIRLLALAYLRKRDAVLILEPTYGEYETTARIHGGRIIRCRATEANGFAPDTGEAAGIIKKHRPRAVFICNPNNPTGAYLARRDIEQVLENLEDGLLVLDEAYIAFVENRWDAAALIERGNIAVLRSMTKDYGLPGLRLGYAAASRDIIQALRRVCPPWSVNAVAQQAGLAVLENDDYLNETLLKIRGAGEYLVKELTGLGFRVLPAAANYFLVKVGSARDFRADLLRHGILVRDCASFGLPEYARISPRTLPECRRLIETIAGLLQYE